MRWWLLAGTTALTLLGGCATADRRDARATTWDRTRAQVAVQLADEQISNGRFDRARALLAAHAERENLPLQERLARIDVEEGEYAAAAQRLAVLREQGLESPGAHETMAIAYEGMGRWELAAGAYAQAYRMQPTAERLVAQIDTLVLAGRAEQARALLEVERGHFPGAPGVQAAAVRLYRHVADTEQVIRELKTALLDRPNNPRVQRELAEAYLKADQPTAAVPLWRQLVSRATNAQQRQSARMSLAHALLAAREYGEAGDIYQVVTLTAADDVRAHVGLATTRLAAGRVDEAESAARRAVELAPEHEDARLALACTLARQGHYDRAIETLDSVGYRPLSPDVREIVARWRARLADDEP